MPVISGGGGGGTPFNGGTITTPLVEDLGAVAGTLVADTEITDSASNRSVSLNLLSQTTDQNEYVQASLVAAINPTTGATRNGTLDISSDGGGEIALRARDTESYIKVSPEGGQTTSVLQLGGWLRSLYNAAPPDAALLAGSFGLWLDSTNGASKLMVKAKSADGTVVSAAIALT